MQRVAIQLMFMLALLASCAGPRLDVENVLARETSPEAEMGQEFPAVAVFDARAVEARAAALESPENASLQVAASRALFQAADVRVQHAALARLDAIESPTLDDVLKADEGLPSELRSEVEALSREGLEFAERALALAPAEHAPEHTRATLYRAINTSLLAWSVTKSTALFEGLGGDCKRATAACLAADESLEGAAPLRLRGRFLAKAPWPLGDRDEAVELLTRATELAPVTLNWLFLGDALYERGDTPQALAAWQRAAESDSDPDSAALGTYHREFARRRVALGT